MRRAFDRRDPTAERAAFAPRAGRDLSCAMKIAALVLLPAAFTALDAAAVPKWTELRANDSVKLSVDSASVKRSGDQVTLSYMLDYAKPQGSYLYQVRYRSVVTQATVRCKARTILMGNSDLYEGPAAKGTIIAGAVDAPKDRKFMAVEKGTSDEDLWRHACEAKAAPKKP